jgi:hypothetical protein
MSKPDKTKTHSTAGRRPYRSPVLEQFGSVGSLTQAGSGNTDEMMPGKGGELMQRI